MSNLLSRSKLREELLQRRKSLSKTQHNRLSYQLCEQLRSFISTFSPQAVHSFLPIYEQKEPELQPLLDSFLADGKTLYTSITEQSCPHLRHVELAEDTAIRPGLWQIPTPVDTKEVPLKLLQKIEKLLVLVPLLGFDRVGHRLGYGKGYYDQFLRQLPRSYALGVSFFLPFQRLESTPQDIQLQACATPKKIFIFKAPTL